MTTTTPEIYIPKNASSLADESLQQQIRIGIQGFGGTGKNWSVLGTPDGKQKGFPNCIILNMDRGCASHATCKDIYQVPFYKVYPKRENHKDDVIEWLNKEAIHLTQNQTLVWDSLSDLDKIYHMWWKEYGVRTAVTAGGKTNEFAEWKVKTEWFNEIHYILKNLRCNVVMLAHEAERPDKPTTVGQPGLYTGKIRPILAGQFGDTIVKEYTDWFRQHSGSKTLEPKPETLTAWGMNPASWKEMQNKFEGNTLYFWQTKSDDLFNAKASSLINPPTYMPATYETFLKYMRNKQP